MANMGHKSCRVRTQRSPALAAAPHRCDERHRGHSRVGRKRRLTRVDIDADASEIKDQIKATAQMPSLSNVPPRPCRDRGSSRPRPQAPWRQGRVDSVEYSSTPPVASAWEAVAATPPGGG